MKHSFLIFNKILFVATLVLCVACNQTVKQEQETVIIPSITADSSQVIEQNENVRDPISFKRNRSAVDELIRTYAALEKTDRTIDKSGKQSSILTYDNFIPDLKNKKPEYTETIGVCDCGEDSEFFNFYNNGIVQRANCLDESVFYVADFAPLPNGLKPGLTSAEVKQLLGKPVYSENNFMSYVISDRIAMSFAESDSEELYHEAIRLFFENDKLKAIWVYSYVTC